MVDNIEPFWMEGWRKDVETILQTLGLDDGRYARSTKAMWEEEEWLMDTVRRMVVAQSVSSRVESMEMSSMRSIWSTTIWSG